MMNTTMLSSISVKPARCRRSLIVTDVVVIAANLVRAKGTQIVAIGNVVARKLVNVRVAPRIVADWRLEVRALPIDRLGRGGGSADQGLQSLLAARIKAVVQFKKV